METTSQDAVKRMCRTCMIQDQDFLPIYDSTGRALKIFEMLSSTAPQIHILNSDEMPKHICVVCLNKLNIAYRFQQMCIKSEQLLRQMLAGTLIGFSSPFDTKEQPALEEDLLQAADKGKKVYIESDGMEEKAERLFSEQICGTSSAKEDFIKEENEQKSDAVWTVSEDSYEDDSMTRKKITKAEDDQTSTSIMQNAAVRLHEIEKPKLRKGKHPCLQCNKSFDTPYHLKRHSNFHSLSRPFQCDVCKYRFSTVSLLSCHKTSHDESLKVQSTAPTDGYKCMECPRRFEKRHSLSAHIQCHRNADPNQVFTCDVCSKIFRKSTSLIYHKRVHPEYRKYKCTQCDKSFNLNSQLSEHMNIHSGLKPFVCMHCNKAFHQSSAFRKHQRIHTGEKPFLCSQCGKSFYNASNLRQHTLRHSDEKRYQCPECPSKFACQSDQIKHMSTHRKIKPHVCDICGSSFTRNYTLTKHKFIHTGERPYKCKQCNMTFVVLDCMRRHMRTHTGEKPYKCQFCDRAYAESSDLNKHLRSHVGEKTYICSQCPQSFKYQQELREHQRQHFKEQQAAIDLIEPKKEI